MIRIAGNITLNDREVQERFVRATGPGGQNARKEATAVELRLDISGSSLPPDVKARLRELGGSGVTTKGVLVVVGRAHRSQTENREDAHAQLATLLQRASKVPKTRRPTRPRKAVRGERLEAKRLRGTVKRSRGQLNDD